MYNDLPIDCARVETQRTELYIRKDGSRRWYVFCRCKYSYLSKILTLLKVQPKLREHPQSSGI